MQNHSLLDNVTIILVDTKSPANIGAVARSMMNMGLSRLVLVNPPKDRNEEAYKLAAGADRIIKEATIVETLACAIAGQNLVIGTSRHPGRLRKNIRPPREMAEQIVPLLSKNRVALVFGNEVNGLDNRDLALCHEIIAIPSSEAFPSLNLSHAVMIVAYELFLAAAISVSSGDRELAPAEDLEQFHLQLQETLREIGFLEQDRPERMMATLRQIFGRARLDSRDVAILRGILTAVDRTRSKGA
ncbi:MAG: RNA methyltransferase [Nitrospirota bacterium]